MGVKFLDLDNIVAERIRTLASPASSEAPSRDPKQTGLSVGCYRRGRSGHPRGRRQRQAA